MKKRTQKAGESRGPFGTNSALQKSVQAGMASSSTLVENVQAAVACAGSGEAAAAVALGAGGESALHQPIVQTIVDSIEGRNSVTFVAPSQSAAAAGATGGQNQCQEEGLDEMERDPQTTEELAAVVSRG